MVIKTGKRENLWIRFGMEGRGQGDVWEVFSLSQVLGLNKTEEMLADELLRKTLKNA